MTELETKLSQILVEKQSKIIPENIKKDIQIFDITGTYEGNSGDVKLFKTEEEMQADTDAKEGDLAVVYRSEIQNMAADTQIQYITFPETVTLPQALTESYYCRLRATDPSKMFDGNIMLDQNSFRFDGWSDTGMIRIQYESEDGINYTRTRFEDDNGNLTNPVDLGTLIHCEMTDEWNDNFGYFMQTGGNVFEGLYEYTINFEDTSIFNFPLLSSITANNTILTFNGEYKELIEMEKLKKLILKIVEEEQYTYFMPTLFYKDNTLYIAGNAFMNPSPQLTFSSLGLIYDIDTQKYYFYQSSRNIDATVYTLDLDNQTYFKNTIQAFTTDNTAPLYYAYEIPTDTLGIDLNYNIFDGWGKASLRGLHSISTINSETYHNSFINLTDTPYKLVNKYIIAPTQLNALPDKLYNSIAYSKDGLIEGTLTQNISNSFNDINADIYIRVQQFYDTIEPRVLTDSDKTIDKNIYCIPTKSDGTPLLDTSQVTDMYIMFVTCTNLQSVPLLDTSKVTNMWGMFNGCTNLTTISLLDTSQVTNMDSMFRNCPNLTTIPQLNTSRATNLNFMFGSCTNLTTIPLLDTSSAANMQGMFDSCTNLQSVPLLDTSNVITMQSMFNGCTNLTTIPLLNTSKVTDMQNMFSGCNNLQNIPKLDTSQVTKISYMFHNCTSLTEIPQLNTSNVINMSAMFSGCNNLQTIPLLDTSKVTNMYVMFNRCKNLSNDTLNNILLMCTNSDVTGVLNKTLKYIGLTEEQAQKCTTLSNYQAFLDAGWITGY